MKRGESLRGQVLDRDGKPVAGARVFFRGPGSLTVENGRIEDAAVGRNAARTDEQGRFLITGGGPEAKHVVVISPHENAWVAPAPKEGSKEELTIRLPQPATLKVIVDIPGANQGNEQQMAGSRIEPAGKDVPLRLQMKSWEMDGWKDTGDFVKTRSVGNPGEVVFEKLTPGIYDFSRTKMYQLGERGHGSFCDRQDVTLLPGETKILRLERNRGQRVGGEIHGLPEDVPGAFITVRPAEASGDPKNMEEWKLPTYDVLTCVNDAKFLTALLVPGQYKIVAYAYRPEPKTGVWRTGIRLPNFVGTALVTIEDDDPTDPKKPAPQAILEMKPASNRPNAR